MSPASKPELRALRALAEFASGGHQPILDIAGLRYDVDVPGGKSRYAIHHGLSHGDPSTAIAHLTFNQLFSATGETHVERLADANINQDPTRASLIVRWLSWFGHSRKRTRDR